MPIIKASKGKDDSHIKHDGSHSTCGWNDRLKTIQTLYKEFYRYPSSKEFFISENISNSIHSMLQVIFWKSTDPGKIVRNKKRDGGLNLGYSAVFFLNLSTVKIIWSNFLDWLLDWI